MFDFHNDSNQREKEAKRQTLLEIVECPTLGPPQSSFCVRRRWWFGFVDASISGPAIKTVPQVREQYQELFQRSFDAGCCEHGLGALGGGTVLQTLPNLVLLLTGRVVFTPGTLRGMRPLLLQFSGGCCLQSGEAAQTFTVGC